MRPPLLLKLLLLLAVAFPSSNLIAQSNPVLTSVNPTSATAGQQVTLTGSGFGASPGGGGVMLGNEWGHVQTWSDTQVVATVDGGSYSGSAFVQTSAGVRSASVTFTVIHPVLSSVSPTSGIAGITQVTLTGSGFGQSQGYAWLGDYFATVDSWSDTQVVATVSPSAISGTAAIIYPAGGWSNTLPFTVILPQLTSISPTAAAVGQQVTLTGTNFGTVQGLVTLGTYPGVINSWSDTQVVATVHPASYSGVANVGNSSEAFSNSISFTVLRPVITAITPSTGAAGTSVTITGTGFGATQGSGTVQIGGYYGNTVVPTSWSDTSIGVNAPPAVVTSFVDVNSYGTASSLVVFHAPTSNFTPTANSLQNARWAHSATVLNDGRVLVTGGVDNSGVPVPGAEVYNPANGNFAFYSLAAVAYSTATLLTNGQILIAGGMDSTETPGATALLFNPQTNTFTATGSLNSARRAATATLLASGKVLIAGGVGAGGTLSSAELYDPVAGTFSLTGSLNTARSAATATLLTNGQVLIVGGYNSSGGSTASAELYTPTTGTFSPAGSLNEPRVEHTATLLNNGQVLIAGGTNTGIEYLSSVELFNPGASGGAGAFSYIGNHYVPSLTVIRHSHAAILLASGKVLLLGGYDGLWTPQSTAEVYDPATQTFSADGNMYEMRTDAAVVPLAGGQVLVVGGYEGYYGPGALSDAELYQPGSQTAPSISLSASPSTSNYGTPVTFTATVTGGTPTPTGTVTFYNWPYPLQTVNLGSNGVATYVTTTLLPGAEGIKAVYNGDLNYLASTSSVVLVGINPAPLTITASSDSMVQGGTVPTITPSYSGFVNGQGPGNLTTQPTCGTSASSTSAPGTYPSTCSGAVDGVYLFTYVPATVTVTAPPSISGLSPATGPIGTVVTISGANFGGTQGSSTVNLNGVPLSGTIPAGNWSNTSIQVPMQADVSPVVVTVMVDGAQSNSQNFTVIAGAGTNVLSDSMGRETFYGFQNVGGRNFMTAVGGRGNTLLSYDALGNNLSSTDALNNTTAFTYDSNGNVLTRTQYLTPSTPLTWSYTYNSFQEVLTATDPLLHVTTNVYDANGNLLSTTTPPPSGTGSGLTTTFQYDTGGTGELVKVIDPKGNATTLTYTQAGGAAPAGLVASIKDAMANTTTFTYDGRGNRLTSKDPLNNTTAYAYDSMNRLTKITAPDTTYTQFGYDYRGRRTSVIDANGKTTAYGYDDADRLTSVTDAALNLTIYGYDTENNMVTITTDAGTEETQFAYDALGRVYEVTFPSNLSTPPTESYTYDAMNNLLSKTDRKQQTINYGYDSLYRLTGKTYPDQTGVTYIYDPLSRLTQVSDPSGNYSFTYDNLGRLTGTGTQYSFLSSALNNSYAYDAASNRVSFTNPQSQITNYSYDSLNRLSTLTDPNTGSFGFGYDALGRRNSLTRPNGVNTSYSYDTLSRLLSVLHGNPNIPGSTSYTYDAAGNRLTKTAVQEASPNPVSVLSQYTYDNIYELTQAVVNGSATEGYTYDAVGNRLTSAGPTTYNYNSSNELISDSTATFTYDNNGNTTSKTDSTGTTSYTWDFENRLTSVALPGTGGTVNFKYDPFGRRIEKIAPTTGTTIYADDGDNITEELGAGGNQLAYFTQGPTIDEPLALSGTGGPYFYHADGLGSITSLTDSSGQVAGSYVYDSYGNLTASTGTIMNPFQYTSREFDSETGLYYDRARYYNPQIGRFLNEDPIRFNSDVNFYRFVTNSPANYIDPLGLDGHTYGPFTWYTNQEGMSATQIAAEQAHEKQHRDDFWNGNQFTKGCEFLESRGFAAEIPVLQKRIDELGKKKCLTDAEKKELAQLKDELDRARQLSNAKDLPIKVYCGDTK